jgi:hypothetical protein
VSVETMSRRISFIERTWQDAAIETREGYVDELGEISSGLGRVTGAEAERAEWLTRRANRVVRKMRDTDADQETPAPRPSR